MATSYGGPSWWQTSWRCSFRSSPREILLGRVSWGDLDPRVTKLFVIFLLSLPVWVVAAKVYGLYDRDEERTEHTTVDDLVGVFHLVTVSVWILFAGAWATGVTTPQIRNTTTFWVISILLITSFRAVARALVRRSDAYVQRALVIGARRRRAARRRKVLHHPEYGIDVVGIVDDAPRELRPELAGTPSHPLDDLDHLVDHLGIDRVVVAFAAVGRRVLDRLRSLRDPTSRSTSCRGCSRSSRRTQTGRRRGPAARRPVRRPAFALVAAREARHATSCVSSLLVVLTARSSRLRAVAIKRDSPGPVFFRQERLGEEQARVHGAQVPDDEGRHNDGVHREYISAIMDPSARATGNGLYKLERDDAVTRAAAGCGARASTSCRSS